MLGVRTGKHPHEVALLVAAFLMGTVGLLFFNTVATTTTRALPFPFGHILYGGLAIGSGVALVGVFWSKLTGALVERVGLYSLAGLSLGYAALIVANSGARGAGFGVFMAAFAIANLIRARQINREIGELVAVRRVLGVEEEDLP